MVVDPLPMLVDEVPVVAEVLPVMGAVVLRVVVLPEALPPGVPVVPMGVDWVLC
ncbi:MAG: hypothetical protein V4669_11115 [Pseudomonadota bacterium]